MSQLSEVDSLRQKLTELEKLTRKSKHALKLALQAEARAKATLALATIDTRLAERQHMEALNAVNQFLGAPLLEEEREPIGWEEVWCPRCKHHFIPSKPGGGA